MADLLKIAEEAFATGKQHPAFKAGDTITVAYKIVEGNKERVQLYRGVVIKIVGHGEKKRFTVRKMSGTIGVERIFPLESPAIESIEVNKVGKVRRASSTTSVVSPARRHASKKSVPLPRLRLNHKLRTAQLHTIKANRSKEGFAFILVYKLSPKRDVRYFVRFLYSSFVMSPR